MQPEVYFDAYLDAEIPMGNLENTTIGRAPLIADLACIQRRAQWSFVAFGAEAGALLHIHERRTEAARGRQPREYESVPNQAFRDPVTSHRFEIRVTERARLFFSNAAIALIPFCILSTPAFSQSHAEICIPLTPPHVPNDTRLKREFADLLQDEFEQYLAEVTAYFSCIDAERERAWREAAEVTQQYGAFLEAQRIAPP